MAIIHLTTVYYSICKCIRVYRYTLNSRTIDLPVIYTLNIMYDTLGTAQQNSRNTTK